MKGDTKWHSLFAYVPFCKAVFTHCTLFLFVKWQSPFVHLCKVAFTHYTCPSLQSHSHPLPMHTHCTYTYLQSGIQPLHRHLFAKWYSHFTHSYGRGECQFAKRCMWRNLGTLCFDPLSCPAPPPRQKRQAPSIHDATFHWLKLAATIFWLE